MSGDFQDWNPDPPDSHHQAPKPEAPLHYIERNPYGGCLRIAIVALLFAAGIYFVVWKWIEPWTRK